MTKYYYVDDYKILYKLENNKPFGYLILNTEWIPVSKIPRNARTVTPDCLDHPAFVKMRFYKELLE